VSRDEDAPRDPLSKAERSTALAIGIGAGGGGAYAVFASANQAGTAILLVLSAIFLLIGIQGTALIRFSIGSSTAELAQRKKAIEQKAMDVAENDPERAKGIIEGAGLARPDLRDFTYAEETIYVRDLESAISELGYEYETSTTDDVDRGQSITVGNSSRDGQVIVEAKYLKQGPLGGDMTRNILSQHDRSRLPLLIVTNTRLTNAALQALKYYTHANNQVSARSVQWRDNSDNAALRDVLADLFSLIPSTRTGSMG